MPTTPTIVITLSSSPPSRLPTRLPTRIPTKQASVSATATASMSMSPPIPNPLRHQSSGSSSTGTSSASQSPSRTQGSIPTPSKKASSSEFVPRTSGGATTPKSNSRSISTSGASAAGSGLSAPPRRRSGGSQPSSSQVSSIPTASKAKSSLPVPVPPTPISASSSSSSYSPSPSPSPSKTAPISSIPKPRRPSISPSNSTSNLKPPTITTSIAAGRSSGSRLDSGAISPSALLVNNRERARKDREAYEAALAEAGVVMEGRMRRGSAGAAGNAEPGTRGRTTSISTSANGKGRERAKSGPSATSTRSSGPSTSSSDPPIPTAIPTSSIPRAKSVTGSQSRSDAQSKLPTLKSNPKPEPQRPSPPQTDSQSPPSSDPKPHQEQPLEPSHRAPSAKPTSALTPAPIIPNPFTTPSTSPKKPTFGPSDFPSEIESTGRVQPESESASRSRKPEQTYAAVGSNTGPSFSRPPRSSARPRSESTTRGRERTVSSSNPAPPPRPATSPTTDVHNIPELPTVTSGADQPHAQAPGENRSDRSDSGVGATNSKGKVTAADELVKRSVEMNASTEAPLSTTTSPASTPSSTVPPSLDTPPMLAVAPSPTPPSLEQTTAASSPVSVPTPVSAPVTAPPPPSDWRPPSVWGHPPPRSAGAIVSTTESKSAGVPRSTPSTSLDMAIDELPPSSFSSRPPRPSISPIPPFGQPYATPDQLRMQTSSASGPSAPTLVRKVSRKLSKRPKRLDISEGVAVVGDVDATPTPPDNFATTSGSAEGGLRPPTSLYAGGGMGAASSPGLSAGPSTAGWHSDDAPFLPGRQHVYDSPLSSAQIVQQTYSGNAPLATIHSGGSGSEGSTPRSEKGPSGSSTGNKFMRLMRKLSSPSISLRTSPSNENIPPVPALPPSAASLKKEGRGHVRKTSSITDFGVLIPSTIGTSFGSSHTAQIQPSSARSRDGHSQPGHKHGASTPVAVPSTPDRAAGGAPNSAASNGGYLSRVFTRRGSVSTRSQSSSRHEAESTATLASSLRSGGAWSRPSTSSSHVGSEDYPDPYPHASPGIPVPPLPDFRNLAADRKPGPAQPQAVGGVPGSVPSTFARGSSMMRSTSSQGPRGDGEVFMDSDDGYPVPPLDDAMLIDQRESTPRISLSREPNAATRVLVPTSRGGSAPMRTSSSNHSSTALPPPEAPFHSSELRGSKSSGSLRKRLNSFGSSKGREDREPEKESTPSPSLSFFRSSSKSSSARRVATADPDTVGLRSYPSSIGRRSGSKLAHGQGRDHGSSGGRSGRGDRTKRWSFDGADGSGVPKTMAVTVASFAEVGSTATPKKSAKEKDRMWDELMRRSDRAPGGTLHATIDGTLALASDDAEPMTPSS
ncbi:hypothetical protein DL93DRAFT_1415956 [Clavulina sp. PMI_390]|nr:hypothetical protein DL93DRAFT_1415956 [Clavulina sp. PMI_390]